VVHGQIVYQRDEQRVCRRSVGRQKTVKQIVVRRTLDVAPNLLRHGLECRPGFVKIKPGNVEEATIMRDGGNEEKLGDREGG
jgi:hypothetical protein